MCVFKQNHKSFRNGKTVGMGKNTFVIIHKIKIMVNIKISHISIHNC